MSDDLKLEEPPAPFSLTTARKWAAVVPAETTERILDFIVLDAHEHWHNKQTSDACKPAHAPDHLCQFDPRRSLPSKAAVQSIRKLLATHPCFVLPFLSRLYRRLRLINVRPPTILQRVQSHLYQLGLSMVKELILQGGLFSYTAVTLEALAALLHHCGSQLSTVSIEGMAWSDAVDRLPDAYRPPSTCPTVFINRLVPSTCDHIRSYHDSGNSSRADWASDDSLSTDHSIHDTPEDLRPECCKPGVCDQIWNILKAFGNIGELRIADGRLGNPGVLPQAQDIRNHLSNITIHHFSYVFLARQIDYCVLPPLITIPLLSCVSKYEYLLPPPKSRLNKYPSSPCIMTRSRGQPRPRPHVTGNAAAPRLTRSSARQLEEAAQSTTEAVQPPTSEQDVLAVPVAALGGGGSTTLLADATGAHNANFIPNSTPHSSFSQQTTLSHNDEDLAAESGGLPENSTLVMRELSPAGEPVQILPDESTHPVLNNGDTPHPADTTGPGTQPQLPLYPDQATLSVQDASAAQPTGNQFSLPGSATAATAINAPSRPMISLEHYYDPIEADSAVRSRLRHGLDTSSLASQAPSSPALQSPTTDNWSSANTMQGHGPGPSSSALEHAPSAWESMVAAAAAVPLDHRFVTEDFRCSNSRPPSAMPHIFNTASNSQALINPMNRFTAGSPVMTHVSHPALASNRQQSHYIVICLKVHPLVTRPITNVVGVSVALMPRTIGDLLRAVAPERIWTTISNAVMTHSTGGTYQPPRDLAVAGVGTAPPPMCFRLCIYPSYWTHSFASPLVQSNRHLGVGHGSLPPTPLSADSVMPSPLQVNINAALPHIRPEPTGGMPFHVTVDREFKDVGVELAHLEESSNRVYQQIRRTMLVEYVMWTLAANNSSGWIEARTRVAGGSVLRLRTNDGLIIAATEVGMWAGLNWRTHNNTYTMVRRLRCTYDFMCTRLSPGGQEMTDQQQEREQTQLALLALAFSPRKLVPITGDEPRIKVLSIAGIDMLGLGDPFQSLQLVTDATYTCKWILPVGGEISLEDG
ncbi:hypothetical protein BC835DRAFT_1424359 [Cytidiella melzeri]|nr:hypothetical protein BC835DRAFT_1424359 [Cytidiella melzeri]